MTTQSVARPITTPEPSPVTGGLTRVTPTTNAIIRTPDEYHAQLQGWQAQRFHVLSPVATFAALPAHLGVVATQVVVNPDPAAGEVYQDRLFCKDDEVALAKPGLARIAQAGGMTIKTERTSPHSLRDFWEVRATLRFIGLDGTPQEIDATAEYDLRDGSARILKMLESAQKNRRDASGQIVSARQYGLRGAEARAINAAIRQFGVRQKYHKADLLKPFLMVRVIPTPDMSDPATRAQVTERQLAGTTAMYGSGTPARALAPAPEVIDVVGDVSPVSGPGTSAPAPPAGRLVLRVDHDPEAGLFDLVLDGGETIVTRSEEVATVAREAQAQARRVQLTTTVVDGAPEVTALTVVAASTPAPSAAALPEGAVLLAKVETFHGISNRNQRHFTKYTVIAVDSRKWTTFSESMAKDAQLAIEKKWPVRIEDTQNPQYPDQWDLSALTVLNPHQPTLPGTSTDDGKQY